MIIIANMYYFSFYFTPVDKNGLDLEILICRALGSRKRSRFSFCSPEDISLSDTVECVYPISV